MNRTTATSDTIDTRIGNPKFYVQLDSGVHLAITDRRDGHGYAVSPATGQKARYIVTGKAIRGQMVRVKVQFAVDTGDAAGTLEFSDDLKTGGRINHAAV